MSNAFYFDGTNSLSTNLFPTPSGRSINQFTWCGFVAPDEDPNTANFNAIGQLGDTVQTILYMQSSFSSGIFRFSINDENPDMDSNYVWLRNKWVFFSITFAVTSTNDSSADYGLTAKSIGVPCSRLDTLSSTTGGGPVNWIESNSGGQGTYSTITSGGSNSIYFGTDSFNEPGASAQCGHRIYDHRLTLAEIERESTSIRAIKRSGLVAEYPMQKANDFKDYSGNGAHLTATGTISIVPGPPLIFNKNKRKKIRALGTFTSQGGLAYYRF